MRQLQNSEYDKNGARFFATKDGKDQKDMKGPKGRALATPMLQESVVAILYLLPKRNIATGQRRRVLLVLCGEGAAGVLQLSQLRNSNQP